MVMTRNQVNDINADRLGRWRTLLVREHATAQATLGVGHDHNSGRLVLCRTEDGPTDASLAALLRAAANELEMAGDARALGLGATGEYPEGSVGPTDQGGLRAGLAFDPATGRIMINFGKPVAWLAMTPAEALTFARQLQIKARDARQRGRE